ncbi:SURF1 family protein [Aquihabitans daechungensis]|uniref:SURF1 family cytochrome oxidase biogenesis protein n=1 Tax=Aquihabitans daechungensis TaxID=1052257 RepID=UPI003BA0A403
MSRYRFALRPRWIISHVFVLAMVVAFVFAGFWQLNRLQEKRDRNDRVAARTAEAVADAVSLARPGDYAGAADLEFRRTTATGTYLADQEVLVRARSRDSAPGSWILTPLQVDDGTAVVVNRGWISNGGQFESVPDRYRAPEGEVTVTGLVRETETRGRFGPKDPTTGTLENLARADIARLDQQVEADVLPFYLQLQEQDPAVTPEDPRPVPAPDLDEGPHLSYALQWFTFALMTVIIYPLILRRRAREIEREALEAELDRADPDDVPLEGDPRIEGEPTAAPGDGSGSV